MRLLVSAALRGAAGGRVPAAGGGRAALRRLSSSAGHPAPAEEREGEVRAGPGRRGAATSRGDCQLDSLTRATRRPSLSDPAPLLPSFAHPPLKLEAFREGVRAWAQAELAPRAAAIDEANAFPEDVDLWRAMGEMGLLGITAPEECGGLGMGYLEHCIAKEELSRASGSVALSYGAHSNLCVNQLWSGCRRSPTAAMDSSSLALACTARRTRSPTASAVFDDLLHQRRRLEYYWSIGLSAEETKGRSSQTSQGRVLGEAGNARQSGHSRRRAAGLGTRITQPSEITQPRRDETTRRNPTLSDDRGPRPRPPPLLHGAERETGALRRPAGRCDPPTPWRPPGPSAPRP